MVHVTRSSSAALDQGAILQCSPRPIRMKDDSMRTSHPLMTSARPSASLLSSLLLSFSLLGSSRVYAQVPAQAEAAPAEPTVAPLQQVSPAAPPAPPPSNPPAVGVVAPTGEPSSSLSSKVAALEAELAETKANLAQITARQDEAEVAALTASGGEAEAPKEEPLRIYGFADMGVQHIWVDEKSILSNVFQINSTSFVIGNVNLYFDAQPIENWRGLIEVRFTNAPLGDTLTYGGIAGTYARADTFSFDPHGTAPNAPMWSGAVVLERAWLEWNEHQTLKLRVGNWFTPFGIWNEDHGSPTLIAMALPQFMLQQWMPVRQTGLMLYGNTFAGEWELGYTLTFSNGRQELSNFNFEDEFGYGGRVYTRRETGALNTTFGVSYFTGTTSDREVHVTGIAPVTFATPTTWEYNEHVVGADASIDIGATRLRAEGMVRRQTYTRGLREPGSPIFAAGSVAGDRWQHSAYLLVAHQLPWAGLEPFLWTELLQWPSPLADGVFVGSIGLNVHFNTAVQWKTQVGRVVFFDWLYDSPYDASIDNVSQIYSRLVMAF